MSKIIPFNFTKIFRPDMVYPWQGANAFDNPPGSALQTLYWSDKSGKRQIYLAGADGSGERNLSDESGFSAANEYEPAVSADGSKLVFCSNRHNTGANNYEVYLADISISGGIENAVKISNIGGTATSNPPSGADAASNIPRFPSIDNNKNYILYLQNQSGGAINAYRISDATTVNTYTVGAAAHMPRFISDTSRFYYSNITANTLWILDFNTSTLASSNHTQITGGIAGTRQLDLNSTDNKAVYAVAATGIYKADIDLSTETLSNNVLFASASEPSSGIAATFSAPTFSYDDINIGFLATGGAGGSTTDLEVWAKLFTETDATDSTQITENADLDATAYYTNIKA